MPTLRMPPRSSIASSRYLRLNQKTTPLPLAAGITPTSWKARSTGKSVPRSVTSCPMRQPNLRMVVSPTSAPFRVFRKRATAAGSMP